MAEQSKETSTTLAVVKTGGKQYLVSPGMRLKVERLKAVKEGQEIPLGEVLLVAKEGEVQVGVPTVSGAVVMARVEGEMREKKIRIVRFKSKSRYHKSRGHRQYKTIVTVTTVG